MRLIGAAARTAPSLREASPRIGAIAMITGCAILTVNDALMKALVTELPLGQLVGLRGCVGFLATVVAAQAMGGLGQLIPRAPRMVATLTGLMMISLFLFPWSLRHIPLADAIMLVYVSPVIVAAASPWLLGERVGWRRWSAIALGLIGTALILNPDGGGVHPAVAAPLIVACLISVRDLMTRRAILADSALTLTAAAMLGAGLAGMATVPVNGWAPLTGTQWAIIGITGLLVTCSQVLMAEAFRHADAAVVSCLKYTSIVWAASFGWIWWGEALGPWDWLGAVLIVLAGVVITLRSRETIP